MGEKGRLVAILVGIVAIFGGIIAWSMSSQPNYSEYYTTITGAMDANGNIADHIKGDTDAKVVIFEYADYQCPGCASMNPRVNKIIEEYSGKGVALVYRNFLLSYHQNGTAAASAAEAAGLQGYWKEYADKLFTNQSYWEYAEANERTNIFVGYFRDVTGGEGNEEKFRSDMGSADVAKKIKFDMMIGKAIEVPGTPAFYIDGERIDFSGMSGEDAVLNLFREKINAKLDTDNK